MGFGSYDESEQKHQQGNDDEDVDAVNLHENDHDGQLSFESDASTDQLVSQLDAMKGDDADE
jgi:hypothetical protein